MSEHKLDLLDNAVDSLEEALVKFEEGEAGETKAYKFAVLHMAHFLELLFKYHLASIHPLLIYRDLFAKKVDKNKTVGLWECVNFINNESPDSITPALRSDLEWIKKLRNSIEHHKFEMDVSEVRETIGRLFHSVTEFLESYSDLDLSEHISTHTKDTFSILSSEYEFSVYEAIKKAEEIENDNFVDYTTDPDAPPSRLDCPECGHYTLALCAESSSGYRCTYCENEDSEDLPATCDICGLQSTVGELSAWKLADNEYELRCYYCSGRYHADKDD
ncbi:TPA: hypothetical protein ACGVAU_004534 [Vibrio vulnificus]|nr:hypothetical protein [Vibrio parahaemolyticus]EHH2514636.1 hypothetical protein [Vibrio parahaemolyticus]EID4382788.1 hypothetical protein [Vibrio parahaemolyticus]EJE4557670.1 hypothetical protein [Vibrio parahaemolyticus]EJG1765634.1 hypothetical protein [Vibrio parahaemolyticus]EKF6809734.1 hypothetical protein [Vibrio parahaemolyticus]